MGLSVCFLTFWGGLIFYLGEEVVPKSVRVGMTVVIWCSNLGYLIYAIKSYAHEFYRDEIKKRKARRQTMNKFTVAKDMIELADRTGLKNWKVHPVIAVEDGEKKDEIDTAKDTASSETDVKNWKVHPVVAVEDGEKKDEIDTAGDTAGDTASSETASSKTDSNGKIHTKL